MESVNVRHAVQADLPQLASALSSAFRDDPMINWLFEEPEARAAQRLRWMRFGLDMGLTRGHVYSVGDDEAAAVWSPPSVSLFDELWGPRMGELMNEQLGESAGAKLASLAEILGHGKVDEPHFYLFILGSQAESQGKGLGAALMEHVLRICDRQGLAAHLESSNPRNIPFYQRHGFEVVGELRLGGDGPLISPMRRPPQRG
jgi:GNAT superfamily N-acetyltransferase